ncbi:hypothetical protein [Paenibacillus methanolicus]|uniref:Uncharacterized protein n=1 Tax=Paenibacillus methanolicus TaxID=582686 RepID=A0A5S5CEL4_9BACL|nr:hypothetical protein [Paenibacillus methanolicus]TYP77797.1 hypothetical protein BCM02_102362 [Paenibacillus methanolicus]
MSRVEKFGRKRPLEPETKHRQRPTDTEASAEIAAASADLNGWQAEEGELPSRRDLYPSHRYKITYWFYRVLIFLFIMLAAGLLMWGKKRYGL